ncbi:MAG: FAD-binding oxidoreductase [Candidatus Limnocylindria bacterium]
MPDAIADREPTAIRSVDELAERLEGRLVRPIDAEYDEARAMFNAMIDRRPALIVRCESARDVVATLAFAREQNVPITVRGGGHSPAGRSIADGAVMIDLSPMKAVEIDAERRTALVGPGAVGSDLDDAALAHGLATTGGTYSGTGVIGLTLGGGMGFLARRFGMAVDNMIGADVVLADGSRVHASADDHQDLFWALRGGGGAFGVVTSLELQVHPIGSEIAFLQAFYPWTEARSVLRGFRDFSLAARDEVGAYALAVQVPPLPAFPEEQHGRSAVAIMASHAGTPDEGERGLRPLAELGNPILSAIVPTPYATIQRSFDDAVPAHQRYYWKTAYLSELPDEGIDAFIAACEPVPGPLSSAYFETVGGAVNRVAPAATAFPHRDAPFNLGIGAGWTDPAEDEAGIRWARDIVDAMTPYATGGMYVNYLGPDDIDRHRAAFGANLDRLMQIKARYDPDGLFQGIPTRP